MLQSQPVNQCHSASHQVRVPQFQRVNQSQCQSLTRKAQAPQPAFQLQSHSVNQCHLVNHQVRVPQFH